jgi:hypothetical protein
MYEDASRARVASTVPRSAFRTENCFIFGAVIAHPFSEAT